MYLAWELTFLFRSRTNDYTAECLTHGNAFLRLYVNDYNCNKSCLESISQDLYPWLQSNCISCIETLSGTCSPWLNLYQSYLRMYVLGKGLIDLLTTLRYSFYLFSAASWEVYKVPLKLTRWIFFLPPETFGLLLGQSSLTSKGITDNPGIIHSDYKGEVQIMSSQILWQFKKGDKIVQLFLLPYMSINSSDDIWTGGFGSTDQKQSLWTWIISEYAWPNINIKINGKRFSGLLDTGSYITIISKHLWPKSCPIQRISCQIAGVSQTKVQEVYQSVQYIHVRDQKASLQHYDLMW